MYTYRKIKVSCTDCPDRFYRIMYIREDLNLYQIGITVLNSLRAEFEHMFEFRDKEFLYVDKSWVSSFDFHPVKDYEKVRLCDLVLNSQNTFTLLYDTGDNWEFSIKLYKKTIEKDEDDNQYIYGFVKEAKGDRIWEDYHYLFWNYLNGGSEFKRALKECGRPWNVPKGPLTHFDDEIDLEELNADVECAIDIEYLLEGKQ